MDNAEIDELVRDAELVAGAGVRLGRFVDPVPFLDSVRRVRDGQAAGGAPAEAIADLQKQLNGAVTSIAPITLYHLKRGWRPFRSGGGNIAAWVFVFGCVLLLISTSWLTLVYDRSVVQLGIAQELHGARAQELMFNLYGIMNSNKKTQPPFKLTELDGIAHDAYIKLIIELYQINKKQISFSSTLGTLHKIWNTLYLISPKLASYFSNEPYIDYSKSGSEIVYNVKNAYSSSFWSGYGPEVRVDHKLLMKDVCDEDVQGAGTPEKAALAEVKDQKPQCGLDRELSEIADLMRVLRLGFDPRVPSNRLEDMFSLQSQIVVLGNWLLPALYGMIGAMIFYLRRFLDPSDPNPSGPVMVYRVILGGFAGIVAVWLVSSTGSDVGTKVSLSVFGLSFIVGFSTDLFFQILDTTVSRIQAAVTSKPA